MRELMEHLAACRAEAQALEAEKRREDRGDEAVFARIRANVFDIFRTVADVAAKKHPERAEARAFYLAKTRAITAQWRAAAEDGDAEARHRESLKLAAAAQAELWVLEHWGGEAL